MFFLNKVCYTEVAIFNKLRSMCIYFTITYKGNYRKWKDNFQGDKLKTNQHFGTGNQ